MTSERRSKKITAPVSPDLLSETSEGTMSLVSMLEHEMTAIMLAEVSSPPVSCQ